MIMDVWAVLWIIVCFTILISILESLHRRAKERRRILQEQDQLPQSIIGAHQYHVYTLGPFSTPIHVSSNQVALSNAVISLQQQRQLQQQQELKAAGDPPPSYDEVVLAIPPAALQIQRETTNTSRANANIEVNSGK